MADRSFRLCPIFGEQLKPLKCSACLLRWGMPPSAPVRTGLSARLPAAVRKFQVRHGVTVRWPRTVEPKTESALLTTYAIKTGMPAPQPGTAPLLP